MNLVLTLVFVFVLIGMFLFLLLLLYPVREPFVEQKQGQEQKKGQEQGQGQEQDPEWNAMYSKWRTLYMDLVTKWKTALTTAIGLERPAPTEQTAAPPPPTPQEMNAYVTLLSQKQGTPLPKLNEKGQEPPTNPTPADLEEWESATNTGEWMAALEWMNRQLEQSFADMEKALKGGVQGFLDVRGLPNEGFADRCQGADIIDCVEQHPEILDKWMAAQKAKEAAARQSKRSEWKKKMQEMLTSASLQQAIKKNNELTAKAKEVQNKATSGELIKDLQLPEMPSDSASPPIKGMPVRTLDSATYNDYKSN